jgi:hypothetical protein
VEVLDEKGSVVNSVPAGKKKGVNIVALPINRKPPRVPPSPRVADGAITGPALTEGTYPVRIIRGKDTVMTKITVKQEKNSPYTAEDRNIRKEAMMAMYTMLNDFAFTVDGITTLRDQAKLASEALPAKDKAKKPLDAMVYELDTLHKFLVNLKEGAIMSENANRLREDLTDNYGTIVQFEGRPNQSTLDRIPTLKGEMDQAEKTFQSIMNKYLPKINAEMKKRGQPELSRKSRDQFDKS